MTSWLSQPSAPLAAVAPRASATDVAGNTLIAGHFLGAWSWGQSTLTSPEAVAAFIAKVDPSGAPMWLVAALPSGPGSWVESTALAVDTAGNVHVAGVFSGALTLGGTLVLGAGQQNMWVATLDPLGGLLRLDAFGTPGGIAVPWNLAVSASGEVALAGVHSGATVFGGHSLGAAGVPGTVLVGFDAAGTYIRGADVGANDWALVLAFTPTSDLVVAGPLGGTLSFDGSRLTSSGRSTGNPDIFVAKLAASGESLWARQFGDRTLQTLSAAAIDPVTSDVAVVGSFTSAFQMDGAVLGAAGARTAFAARFDSQGTLLWARAWGGHEAHATSVSFDAAGALLIGGSFAGPLDIGGGLDGPRDERRVWVARLDGAGEVEWAVQSTGLGIHGLHSASFDPEDDVRLVVSFDGQASIDGLDSEYSEKPSFFAARIEA